LAIERRIKHWNISLSIIWNYSVNWGVVKESKREELLFVILDAKASRFNIVPSFPDSQ
jgi:hypothetical protein